MSSNKNKTEAWFPNYPVLNSGAQLCDDKVMDSL